MSDSMSCSKLIAFCGYKGSGKNTAAKAIGRRVEMSFAGPLKNVCQGVFDLSYEELNDPVLKEQKLDRWPFQSPRQIIQTVGTDMFRTHYHDVWLQKFRRDAELNLTFCDQVVVTDLRFQNEEALIRELGGMIIRVHRPSIVPTDPHSSEAYIPYIKADLELINNAPDSDGFIEQVQHELKVYQHAA